jgi:beta-xylosidase
VHVYCSRDLYNWKDQGIALAVAQDTASEIAAGCILERPKVLFNEKTGKFVMWFHLECKGQGYGSSRSGVAVAEQVTGPYRYLYSLRPNAGVWPEDLPQEQRQPLSAEEQGQLAKYQFTGGPPAGLAFPTNLVCRRDYERGQMARDMNLFLDDDGKAYQIYSSEENGTLQISQLAEDYLRPAGRYGRVLVGQFNEAPALFKKGGAYFLFTSGTTGWKPNPCRSFSAASIWGPWTPLGNPCRGSEAQRNETFESQSTYVLAVQGRRGQFIFMADRWRPENAIDGRYVWLPVRFDNGQPVLEWKESWSLNDRPPRLSRADN